MRIVKLTKVKTDRLYYEVNAKYLYANLSGDYVPMEDVEKIICEFCVWVSDGNWEENTHKSLVDEFLNVSS